MSSDGQWSRASRYELPAPVTFGSILTLRAEAQRQLDAAAAALEVSFGGREHSGSAGVALMMGLLRYAHGAGKAIRFAAVPGDLRNIIELAELDDVLPVVPDAAATRVIDEQHNG